VPSQWKINAFFDKLKQPLAHAKPAAFTLPCLLRSALLILVPILRACVLYIYAHTVVSARLPYSTLCSTGYPPSMRTRHPTHTPHALACILHTIPAPSVTPVLPPASHSRALRATVSHSRPSPTPHPPPCHMLTVPHADSHAHPCPACTLAVLCISLDSCSCHTPVRASHRQPIKTRHSLSLLAKQPHHTRTCHAACMHLCAHLTCAPHACMYRALTGTAARLT